MKSVRIVFGTFLAAAIVLVLLSVRTRSRQTTLTPRAFSQDGKTAAAAKSVAAADRSSSTTAAEQTVPEIPPALGAFGSWAQKYLTQSPPAGRGILLAEGEALAKARRSALKQLMQENPEVALAQLVPYSLRQKLPDSIKAQLEEPVSGRGKLEWIEFSPLPGHESEMPEAWYKVELNHQIYHAYFAAKRARKPGNGLGFVGAAIDNVLALSKSPPILDEAQVKDLIRDGKISTEPICSVSGKASKQPVAVDIGGRYHLFCTVRHAQDFQARYVAATTAFDATSVQTLAAESALDPTQLPPRIHGTQGPQKLLVIPVAYADDPRMPESQDGIAQDVLNNNQYYESGSYETVSFISTVTPLLTLPERKTYYGEYLDTALRSDAETQAILAGYDTSEYDFIYVIFNSIPGVKFGGRSDGLLNGGAGAISHELGHNFGLSHANFWNIGYPGPPTNNLPIDRDSQIGHYDVNAPFAAFGVKDIPIQEYGNPFDVMGSGSGHFSASAKNHMNWLPDKSTRIIPTVAPRSETNRVYAFDTPHIGPGRIYAVRIRKNANEEFPEFEFSDGSYFGGRTYWATYRQGVPNNPWLSTGIQLNWDAAGASQNELIDVTPDTSAGKNDSAVVVGRTFADPEVPFYLTPVAQGGGPDPSDKWIDVVVNIGPFPENLPPTISLSASALNIAPGDSVTFVVSANDPNGDVLAYNWDFGDGSFGSNLAINNKTFPAAGKYVVRCEVSDMKGGVASALVVVVVGEPSTFSVSGHVVDIFGNPLQGVRVHNGGTPPPFAPPAPVGYPASPPPTNGSTYAYTYTDSQGSFTIANLPAGTNYFGAFIYGYKIEPLDFANPVALQNGDVQGLTFMATPLTKVHVVADSDAFEGPSPGAGTFNIFRDGDTSQDLEVRFALGGTAVTTTDYENIGTVSTNVSYTTNGSVITTNYTVLTNTFAGSIVIPAGQSFTNVLINPIDNDLPDGTRTVRLSLMLATNDIRITSYLTNVFYTNMGIRFTNTLFVYITNNISIPGWDLIQIAPDNQPTWFQSYPTYILETPVEAVVNIFDDEPALPPFVSVFVLDSIATESANDCASVTFNRQGSADEELTVYYNLSGAASNGIDYVTLPGVITIPAGQRSVTLPIIAINDLFVEGPEDVSIEVADDPNQIYTAIPGPATVTIIDDDLPSLSIYAPDSLASKTGNDSGRITIVRSGDLSSPLLVNYLVTGTALSGVDYNTLSGSVTIPADRVSADVVIRPIANSPSVGNRTVTVVLSDSPSYNIDNLNKASVTIQDTALPVVTLTVSSANATEGGTPGVFTVTRTGSTSGSLTVPFAVGGSAIELSDYAAIGANVTIPAGSATATITITPLQDKFRELGDVSGSDTVIVQLLGDPSYNLGSPTSGTVTIGDDDASDLPVVSFMKKSSSGREDSGDAFIAVRVSGNPATNKPIVVAYRITSGSAVQGINYSFVGTGRLDFSHFDPPKPPDPFHDIEDGIQFIDIPLLNDGVAAGDKTFTITLFNFVGYTTNTLVVTDTNTSASVTNIIITPIPTNQYLGEFRSHTFTILDIGTTVVNIEAPTPLAFEEGSRPGYFRISREGSTNSPLTVKLAISGTAAAGSDYVPLPASVTIPAGTNQVFIPVTPFDDPQEEPAESVIVGLLAGSGFAVGSASAMVIIVDNDGTIQFTKANYEVEENVGDAVIDVVRTGNTNRAATVDYQILDGTAVLGDDYNAGGTNGTLFFAAGETLKQIHVAIVDDSIVEAQETISLVLTNPTGGVPLGGQRVATLFINDNDISFQFVTNSFLVNENGGTATITVERLGLAGPAATVVFDATPGTAKASDFVGTNVTLIFDLGETNKTVLLQILDDQLFDGDQTVNLSLSQSSTNASVGPTTNAVLTIIDDECAIGFDSPTYSANEYAPFATVIVHRTGGTVNPVSVNYHTVDGSANGTDTNNLDYLAQSGTITFLGDQMVVSSNGTGEVFFQPGETVKVITIPLVDDTLGEGNETFNVVLTDLAGPPGASANSTAYGPNTNAVVTIIDNETPGSVDFEFNPGEGANDTVFSVALQPSGAIVFGGQFTRVNNITYNSVARLHPNGTLDTSFNPGRGVNGPVLAVASQEDGKVLVGGSFSRVDGTNRLNFARLNANGHLDVSFDSSVGADDTVWSLAIQTNGMVLLGGDFATVGSVAHPFLARVKTDGSVDDGFGPAVDGPVYSIALQTDGKIIIGGAFNHVGGDNHHYVARLNPNGSVDNGFGNDAGPNNTVYSVAVADDGKIVIGGLFTQVDGHARGYVSRLAVNGNLDLSFAPVLGADALVSSVAVQPAGEVVIGGDFTSFDGQSRNGFARIRPDGSLDVTFNIGAGANNSVNAVALQSDTAIVIGGSFTTVNGLPRNRIARIHGDDKYIPVSVQFSTASYVVKENDGSVLIPITRIGNLSVPFNVTFLTRDGTATVNSDYLTNHTVLSFAAGETGKVVSVTIIDDTALEPSETINLLLTDAPSYVDLNLPSAVLVIEDNEKSVQFGSTNYTTLERSNAVINIVRSGDASLPVSVQLNVTGGTATSGRDYVPFSGQIDFATNETEKAVVVTIIDDSNKEFDETIQIALSNPVGAQIGLNNSATITIIDDDLGPGSIDLRFDPGTGADGLVKAVAIQPDGNILIGGAFTNINTVSRSRIGRLQSNGQLDLTFDPGIGADGLVAALAVRDNGSIIAGGAFSQINGTNRNRLAQFLTNGVLDAPLSQSNGINAAVYSLAAVPQGKVVFGGSFSLPLKGIGRIRTDGGVDPSFFPGVGPNGIVYSIAQQPDGKLIAMGDFTSFNNNPRSRVARLQADGTLDGGFATASVITGAVYCGAVQLDGKVLIGGDFFRVGGIDRGHFARLNTNGTVDTLFGTNSGADGIVYAMALQPDGRILIGGNFTSINGTNRSRIARLNSDGGLDLTFDPGTGADGPVYAIGIQPDRAVVIGGDFNFVNTLPRRGIARLNGDADVDIEFQPGSHLSAGQFLMQLSVNAGRRYVLEISPNLINWTPLSTNTASSSFLNLSDPNAGAVNHRFYRALELNP